MHELALSAIELFSGTGMLGEGVRAGLRYLGIEYRTVVHVEREAFAASVLAARMEEESMDDAPIWSDVCTFDAEAWRGKVDIVVAGFPCQDLSIAGRRVGLDGKRSGLFFEVVRIARDSGAEFLVLENVRGISSATASVVDEAEGALEERAAARVLGELADCGWDAEWIVVSASDVGASHDRARWFCLAWRMDDATRDVGDGLDRESRVGRRIREAGHELGDARLQHINLQQRPNGDEHPRAGVAVDDAKCSEWRPACPGGVGREQGANRGWREADGRHGIAGEILEFAEGDGRHQWWPEPTRQQGRSDVTKHGGTVADASGTRSQGSQFAGTRNFIAGGQQAYGSTRQFCGLFAPGPSDQRWAGIIAGMPWLAPALSIEQELDAPAAYEAAESEFRRVVDGLAPALDFGNRSPQLKCIGNGVVPLCAAAALVVLVRRSGILKRHQ